MRELLPLEGYVVVQASKGGEVYYEDEGENLVTFWGKQAIVGLVAQACGQTPNPLVGDGIRAITLGSDGGSGSVLDYILQGTILLQAINLVPDYLPPTIDPIAFAGTEEAVFLVWETTLNNGTAGQLEIQEVGLHLQAPVDTITWLCARRVLPAFVADPTANIKVTWKLRIG